MSRSRNNRFGISPLWRKREADGLSKAEHLAITFGNCSAPIPLKPIAEYCGVREFHFAPRLVGDGGLDVRHDGFVMSIDCPEDKIKNIEAQFHDPHDAGRFLPPRMRFTIAHEIAHTFYFEFGRGSGPRSVARLGHAGVMDSLERTCNRIANRLLLPEAVLCSTRGDHDIMHTAVLRGLCGRFGVSPDVLINRVQTSRLWWNNRGIVAVLREHASKLRVDAIGMDVIATRLFGNVNYGDDPASLLRRVHLEIGAAGSTEYTVEVPCACGARRGFRLCAVTSERVRTKPGAYLLAVKILDTMHYLPPQAGGPQ